MGLREIVLAFQRQQVLHKPLSPLHLPSFLRMAQSHNLLSPVSPPPALSTPLPPHSIPSTLTPAPHTWHNLLSGPSFSYISQPSAHCTLGASGEVQRFRSALLWDSSVSPGPILELCSADHPDL